MVSGTKVRRGVWTAWLFQLGTHVPNNTRRTAGHGANTKAETDQKRGGTHMVTKSLPGTISKRASLLYVCFLNSFKSD